MRPEEVYSLSPWVYFQDVKKSRLPILIKASRPLGSVCQLPAPQEVVAQQQGELKEFKIHNKQRHQKLILAETVMEGRPAPEKALLKGKHQGNRILCEKMNGVTGRPETSAALFGIAIRLSINFMNCSD